MVVIRDKVSETIATIRGFFVKFFVFGLMFFILGTIALANALDSNWGGIFTLGNVPIPKFYGAGATNYQVFILCIVALVVLAFAIVSRYFYYRSIIQALREKGITDYDNDGQVDSFADSFLDDDFG